MPTVKSGKSKVAVGVTVGVSVMVGERLGVGVRVTVGEGLAVAVTVTVGVLVDGSVAVAGGAVVAAAVSVAGISFISEVGRGDVQAANMKNRLSSPASRSRNFVFSIIIK
jgi:hypothetical protein